MADQKLTALTAATSWASGDILYMVGDPAGTPVSRKITVDNIFATLNIVRGTNTFELRNSTNAQGILLNNTYASGSVYERGFMRWASNVLEIGTEHVGGSARSLRLMVGTTVGLTVDTTGRLIALANNAAPSYSFSTNTATGLGDNGSGSAIWYWVNGSVAMNVASGQVNLPNAMQMLWSSTSASTGTKDTGLIRTIAGVLGVTNGSTGGGALGLVEMTSPAAPATNGVYIFAEDNGGGKTRLMARFATGATQQLAIEP